jgi:hypothetical protein
VVGMSKLGRLWDWLLPGLISLNPCGAIAYYSAGAENQLPRPELVRARRRESVPGAVRSTAIIPLAHL